MVVLRFDSGCLADSTERDYPTRPRKLARIIAYPQSGGSSGTALMGGPTTKLQPRWPIDRDVIVADPGAQNRPDLARREAASATRACWASAVGTRWHAAPERAHRASALEG